MHQRQEGSAAAQNKMRQGKIFFEKTLTASSLPPHSQLVVPALFVEQHGDKMHKCVTLRNVENGKRWVVEINVQFPQNRTQALLYYGWRAFAAANGLAIGDRLTFVLVAQSLFDVYILRRGGNSSLSVEEPKACSPERRSVRRGPNPKTKLCPGSGPQLSCDIPANGCEGKELTRAGVTKESAEESTGVAAEVAAETPDSHCVEPMTPQEEQDDCIICQIARLTQLGMMKSDFHTAFNE